MKRTFRYKTRRWIQSSVLRFKKLFRSDRRARYPKNSSNSEKTAAQIFIKLLHDPDSKLYYDLVSHECYLRSNDSSLYLFLERDNLKVINSVYGYDIRLSAEMESYLTERFKHEMAKRRKIFKNLALSKVKHSLEQTLDKINKMYGNDENKED